MYMQRENTKSFQLLLLCLKGMEKECHSRLKLLAHKRYPSLDVERHFRIQSLDLPIDTSQLSSNGNENAKKAQAEAFAYTVAKMV